MWKRQSNEQKVWFTGRVAVLLDPLPLVVSARDVSVGIVVLFFRAEEILSLPYKLSEF